MNFYRVLTSKDAFDRWQNGNFTASHCLVPGEWNDLYYRHGRREIEDFPLTTAMATYSLSALKAFLRLAPEYQHGAIWGRDDLRAISEVDGVCAWRKAEDAMKFANDVTGGCLIAVFEGEETGPLPEPGGVCARVVKVVEVLSKADLEAKYCLSA